MSKFVVAVRVRPLTKKEQKSSRVLSVELQDEKCIVVHNLKLGGKKKATWEVDSRRRVKRFNFDHVFWSVDPTHPSFSSQAHVYRSLCDKVLPPVLKGFNSCMFAYGQTGSGKTHTMMGDENDVGFIPRLCEDLFERLEKKKTEEKDDITYRVFVSFIEVYNEKVYDLLSKTLKKSQKNDQKNVKDIFCSNQSLESSIQSCREFKSCCSLKTNGQLETPPNDRKTYNIKPNPNNKPHNYSFQNHPRHNLSSYTSLPRPKPPRHHQQALRVREHPEKGPFVEGLVEHEVDRVCDVRALLKRGNSLRTTAATHMHKRSSRSHAIFTVTFIQARLDASKPMERRSKINLVDLAGSERSDSSGCYSKERAIEGAGINKSLATLATVIQALAHRSLQVSWNIPNLSPRTAGRQCHIPYRDSTLTWLLKDSLQGNAESAMIATISPSSSCYFETINTLYYGQKANEIINKPHINEDPVTRLIRGLREEISRLKSMLRKQKMKDANIPYSDAAVGTEDIFRDDDDDEDEDDEDYDNDVNDDNDSGYPKTKDSIENFETQKSEDIFGEDFYGLKKSRSDNRKVIEMDNIGNSTGMIGDNYDEEEIIMQKLMNDEVKVDQLTRKFIKKWRMKKKKEDEEEDDDEEEEEESEFLDASDGRNEDTKEERMSRESCGTQQLCSFSTLEQLLESLPQGLTNPPGHRGSKEAFEHAQNEGDVLNVNEVLEILRKNGLFLQQPCNKLEVKQNETSGVRLVDEKRPSPIGSEDVLNNQLSQKPSDQLNNSLNLKACLYVLSDLKNLSQDHLNIQEINKIIQMYLLTHQQTDKCADVDVDVEADDLSQDDQETNNLPNNTLLTDIQAENTTTTTTQPHNNTPTTPHPNNTTPIATNTLTITQLHETPKNTQLHNITPTTTNNDTDSSCSEDSLDHIDTSHSLTKPNISKQNVEVVDQQCSKSLIDVVDVLPLQLHSLVAQQQQHQHNMFESVEDDYEEGLKNDDSQKSDCGNFNETRLDDENSIRNITDANGGRFPNGTRSAMNNQSENTWIDNAADDDDEDEDDVEEGNEQCDVTSKNEDLLEGDDNDDDDEDEDHDKIKVVEEPLEIFKNKIETKGGSSIESNKASEIEGVVKVGDVDDGVRTQEKLTNDEVEGGKNDNDDDDDDDDDEGDKSDGDNLIQKFQNIKTSDDTAENYTIPYGENVKQKSSTFIFEENKEIECRLNDKMEVIYDSAIKSCDPENITIKQGTYKAPKNKNLNKISTTKTQESSTFLPLKQHIYTPVKHMDKGVNCDLECNIGGKNEDCGGVYGGSLNRLTNTDVLSFNINSSVNNYFKPNKIHTNTNSLHHKPPFTHTSKEKNDVIDEISGYDDDKKNFEKELANQNTLVSASYLKLSNPRVDSGDEGDVEFEYIGLQPLKNNDRKQRNLHKKHSNIGSCVSKFSIGFNVPSDTDNNQLEINDRMKSNTNVPYKSSHSPNLSNQDNNGGYQRELKDERYLKFHKDSPSSLPPTPSRISHFPALSHSHTALPRVNNNDGSYKNDLISEDESVLDLSTKSIDESHENPRQNGNRFNKCSENLNRTIDFSLLPSYKYNSNHLSHEINIFSFPKNLSKSDENLLDNDLNAFEDLLPYYHPLPSPRSPLPNNHSIRHRAPENLFETPTVSNFHPPLVHSSVGEMNSQKSHLSNHKRLQSKEDSLNHLNSNPFHGRTTERSNEIRNEKFSTSRVPPERSFNSSGERTKNCTVNDSTSSINSITLVLEEGNMSPDEETRPHTFGLNSKQTENLNSYENFSETTISDDELIVNRNSFDEKLFKKSNVQTFSSHQDQDHFHAKYEPPSSNLTSHSLKTSKKETQRETLASYTSHNITKDFHERSTRDPRKEIFDENYQDRYRVAENNIMDIKNHNCFTKSCQTSFDKLQGEKHGRKNYERRIKELEKEKIEITRLMGEGLSVWKTKLELMEARLNYNMGQTDLLLSILQNEESDTFCEPVGYDVGQRDELTLMCLDKGLDGRNTYHVEPFKSELFNKKYFSKNVPRVEEEFVNTRIEKIQKHRLSMSNELVRYAEEL